MTSHTDRAESNDDGENPINRTLYVHSLAPKATEEELTELFMQAGPLEKVAMPSHKPGTAFVTYKHSVSVPYAKELFSDTRVHGRYLQLAFRHGSTHSDSQRSADHSAHDRYTGRYSNTHGTGAHGSHYGRHSQDQRYQPSQSHNQRYSARSRPQDPFTANSTAFPVQEYRSATHHREYDPQAPAPLFVSFANPPANFTGGAPLNQPGHPVDLETRRQRLLTHQHYATQTDSYRKQRRHDNRYR